MRSLGTRRLEARRDPLLTEKVVISVGPQHPSLVAPVQLHIQADGELMESVRPEVGFMHRGIEHLAMQRPWGELGALLSRCEWLAGSYGDYLAAAAVEELAGIEVPPRAVWLRTLVLELSRLSSHLFWFGDLGIEMGVYTPMMWAIRDREPSLDLLAELSGNRYHHGWIVPGGVADEPPAGWLQRCADYGRFVIGRLNEYEDFFSDNAIFVNRAELVGPLDPEFALLYGASGPVLRGSGISHDLRRDAPYLAYGELGVRVPVGEFGDSLDRYRVRFQEMRESVRLIEACVEVLSDSGSGGVPPLVAAAPSRRDSEAPGEGGKVPPPRVDGGKVPPPQGGIIVPPGEAYIAVEGPRGELALSVVSDGGPNPARAHLRGPSLYHIMLLPELCKGHLLADLFVIYASLDIMVGEIDR